MVLQVTGKGDPVFRHNDNFWDEDDDKIDKAEQLNNYSSFLMSHHLFYFSKVP